MIRAAPHSRWVHSDFQDWRFGAVAGHASSLLDGFLLLNYLMEPASSDDELQTGHKSLRPCGSWLCEKIRRTHSSDSQPMRPSTALGEPFHGGKFETRLIPS